MIEGIGIEGIGIEGIGYPISWLIQRDDLFTGSSGYSSSTNESRISIIGIGLGGIGEDITCVVVGVGRDEYTGSCIYTLGTVQGIVSIVRDLAVEIGGLGEENTWIGVGREGLSTVGRRERTMESIIGIWLGLGIWEDDTEEITGERVGIAESISWTSCSCWG